MIHCWWNLNKFLCIFSCVVTMVSAAVRVHYGKCVKMNSQNVCAVSRVRVNFFSIILDFLGAYPVPTERGKINDNVPNQLPASR